MNRNIAEEKRKGENLIMIALKKARNADKYNKEFF